MTNRERPSIIGRPRKQSRETRTACTQCKRSSGILWSVPHYEDPSSYTQIWSPHPSCLFTSCLKNQSLYSKVWAPLASLLSSLGSWKPSLNQWTRYFPWQPLLLPLTTSSPCMWIFPGTNIVAIFACLIICIHVATNIVSGGHPKTPRREKAPPSCETPLPSSTLAFDFAHVASPTVHHQQDETIPWRPLSTLSRDVTITLTLKRTTFIWGPKDHVRSENRGCTFLLWESCRFSLCEAAGGSHHSLPNVSLREWDLIWTSVWWKVSREGILGRGSRKH